jgi:2-methylcitrate dehydratase PrpD
VIHPAIDGAIQLRDEFNLQPEQIKSIHIKANPYQLELCGKKTPQTGLEGKFSVYHSVAIALIDGRAGEKQYSDEAVRHPKTISLREKITVEIDKRLHKKSGEVTITLNDGRVLNKVIESAVGGLENPMTNEQLDEKFLDLTTDILPMAKCQELLADTWRMAELPSAGDFAKSTVA